MVDVDLDTVTQSVISTLTAKGMIKPMRQRAEQVNWEKLLAREYVGKFYENKPKWFRIEVGPIPHNDTTGIYSRVRRWADAIIRMPDHMLIIEFKMKAQPGVISQIQHYATLFSQTPGFEKYWNEPLKLKVVVALDDPLIKQMAENNGIEYENYKPSNYEAWYKKVILENYGRST